MFIRSERLFLRPGWPEDWAELLALIDDEAVARNLASAPWPYRPDHARDYASRPQADRHPHFFVTLPGAHGTRLIGCVALAEFGGDTELGFWIARRYWNRGYGTEAIRALLALARTLGHRHLVASHFLDNPAGARVLAKAGFTRTGDMRPRFSPARQGAATSVLHTIDLGCASNCDGDDDGPMTTPDVMRAA